MVAAMPRYVLNEYLMTKDILCITNTTSEAIFENGVFKPLEKIHIKEHEKVTIIPPGANEYQAKECNLHGIIDIAKDCSDTGLSIHHDRYLYGEGTD